MEITRGACNYTSSLRSSEQEWHSAFPAPAERDAGVQWHMGKSSGCVLLGRQERMAWALGWGEKTELKPEK